MGGNYKGNAMLRSESWILFVSLVVHVNSYSIGLLYNNASLVPVAEEAARDINGNRSLYGLGSNTVDIVSHALVEDVFQATTDICQSVFSKKVHIVVSTNTVNASDPRVVAHACGYYKIPVVAVEARETKLSDKQLYGSLLRTVPSYSDQARVWASLIRALKWSRVNLVSSDDYDNRMTFVMFTALAFQNNIAIEFPIIFPSGTTNLTTYLSPLQTSKTKVIVLACSSADAINVYDQASRLQLTGKGFVWIVNEQAITGEAPQGVLGVRLQGASNLENHIRDAVTLSAKALGKLSSSGKLGDSPPTSCDEPAGRWNTGNELYKTLVNTTFDGWSGQIKFNSRGDRSNPTYDIVNLAWSSATGSLYPKVVGTVSENVSLSVDEVVWPGNQTGIPAGVFLSNHLQVVTVESQPFVYLKQRPASKRCQDLDTVVNGKTLRHIPCRGARQIGAVVEVDHCCSGFCIDLLIRLADRVNFTYDLNLAADGLFGSLKKVNGSNERRWNGVVGEVIDGKADLAVASLTINNERAQYIEFSKPFKYTGITILVKKNTSKTSLDSFLRPFKTELWLLVLLSVHVVAVILYLLDRFSPFGTNQLVQSDKAETALNLSSAMWFSWGVLLNSGIGEATPRSFSARVLAMVWAGFAMIVVASYTANLAAFLVLDRPKPVVSGLDDPHLRNPSDNLPYATVANSSVDAYFRRQVELASMYTFMQSHNVETEQEGIDKVKSGELKAFIWDSPVLFHHTSQDCTLTTVGDLFGQSGYGIAMPKGSPWSNAVSLAVLYFHESGTVEELESTWINFGDCQSEENTQTTLGLQHMLGVFIMVGAGTGAGIVIVILEVVYYRLKGWRKHQKKVVQSATAAWQGHIQDKKRTAHTRGPSNFRNRINAASKSNIHLNGGSPSIANHAFEIEAYESKPSTELDEE